VGSFVVVGDGVSVGADACVSFCVNVQFLGGGFNFAMEELQ